VFAALGVGLGTATAVHPNLGVLLVAVAVWIGLTHGWRMAGVALALGLVGWSLGPRPLLAVDFRTGPYVGLVTLLRVPRVTSTGVSAPVRLADGSVRVASWEGRVDLAHGETLAVRGVRLPPTEGQDGTYRLRGWSGRLRVVGSGERIRGGTTVSVLGQGIRNRFGAFIESQLPGDRGALVRALCFNEDSSLSAALRDDLARTGTVHIVSTSGMHVMLVAAILLGAFSFVPLPRWTQLILVLAFLLIFAAAAGDRPPALRAVAMFGLAGFAYVARRPFDAFNALAVIFTVFTVLDPPSLFEPGFQLSFAAMGALVTAPWSRPDTPPIRRRGWWVRAGLWLRLRLPQIMGASLRATAVTLPLTAYWFGQVSWVGPVANLVVAPISSLIVQVGLIGWSLVPIPGLSGTFVGVLGALADALMASVEGFARVPGAFSRVPPPPAWAVAAFLVAYFVLMLREEPIRRPRPKPSVGTRLAVVLVALIGLGLGGWGIAGGLGRQDYAPSLAFIQVGQGDATLIQSQGVTMLVDAGPRLREWDAGERLVAPELYRRGVRSLDLVSLSHADMDHIGGLPALARRFRIDQVVISRAFRDDPELRKILDEAGLADRVTWIDRAMQWRVGEVQVQAWPPSPDPSPEGLMVGNETSVILRVSARGRAVVLPGDATWRTEQAALTAGIDWRADGLLLGHHGSRTSTSPAWLDAIGPRWVVVSCGRGNRYGHPTPETLSRVTARGIAVGRLDRQGTLEYSFDGAGLRLANSAKP